MRVLVWQWGRRGAGPRYAVQLAQALDRLPDVAALLSLSRQAEIMLDAGTACDLPVDTYAGAAGYARRLLFAPLAVRPLAHRLRRLRATIAVCAMPGPLDLLMAAALLRAGVPFVVVVHDADAHPGDGLPLQMTLQARLLRRAAALVALSGHVAERLAALHPGRPVLRSVLGPLDYGAAGLPPGRHGGRLRVLSFGRLLPYKGLDLLAAAWRLLPPGEAELRVVGSGPESDTLAALRALPDVTVENRWVPETEVGALLAWADVVVLSHTEASQSGVAAAARAAGRWIVGTDVGGLREQLHDDPAALLCPPRAADLAASLRAIRACPPPMPGAATAAAQDAAAALAAALRPLSIGQA